MTRIDNLDNLVSYLVGSKVSVPGVTIGSIFKLEFISQKVKTDLGYLSLVVECPWVIASALPKPSEVFWGEEIPEVGVVSSLYESIICNETIQKLDSASVIGFTHSLGFIPTQSTHEDEARDEYDFVLRFDNQLELGLCTSVGTTNDEWLIFSENGDGIGVEIKSRFNTFTPKAP